jgi:hypothetical protein
MEAVPSILHLEQVAAAGDWVDVLAAVFNEDLPGATEAPHPRNIRQALTSAYNLVAPTGVPLVAINTLVDVIQVQSLLEGEKISRATLLAELKKAQAQSPDNVRIHVDRGGRPAYVKFGDSLLKNLPTVETQVHTRD